MRTDPGTRAESVAAHSKSRPIRRVGVTGAAGKVGLLVVEELAAHRYDVVGVDRRVPSRPLPAVFREADLLDDRMLSTALGDCDAIVHLAIPTANPGRTTAQQLEEGVRLTSNVLAQAERSGISRVALASSEVAVGYSLGPSPFAFDYLPVDEAHPLRPSDHYGISKQLCERLAEKVALRAGITIVALRPSWVLDLDCMTRREWARRFHGTLGEHPFNFWSYVDARDTARAFRLALEAPLAGFQPFFIAAPDTRHHLPTLDLLRHFFRDALPPGAPLLNARQCILSTERAERLLGWRATRTWTDLPKGTIGGLVRRAMTRWRGRRVPG